MRSEMHGLVIPVALETLLEQMRARDRWLDVEA